MILFPLLGAALQAFIPQGARRGGVNRWIALASSVAGALCALLAVFSLEAQPGLQAIESYIWIRSYAIGYEMGMDGLNVLPCLLVAIVFPLLIASQWNQKSGMRGMNGLLLRR